MTENVIRTNLKLTMFLVIREEVVDKRGSVDKTL